MDVARVEATGALTPVGTHSRPCSQDGLGLWPHIQHLVKREKKLQNFSDEGHHKPANVIQAKGSHLLLPVAVAPASISWGDYLVPLQLQH